MVQPVQASDTAAGAQVAGRTGCRGGPSTAPPRAAGATPRTCPRGRRPLLHCGAHVAQRRLWPLPLGGARVGAGAANVLAPHALDEAGERGHLWAESLQSTSLEADAAEATGWPIPTQPDTFLLFRRRIPASFLSLGHGRSLQQPPTCCGATVWCSMQSARRRWKVWSARSMDAIRSAGDGVEQQIQVGPPHMACVVPARIGTRIRPWHSGLERSAQKGKRGGNKPSAPRCTHLNSLVPSLKWCTCAVLGGSLHGRGGARAGSAACSGGSSAHEHGGSDWVCCWLGRRT